MSKARTVSLTCVSAGLALGGCATAPVQTAGSYASQGAHVTYAAASTGAHAVYTTGGAVYSGMGAAAKEPFRDLNLMQEPIPPVLLRTESKPYDLVGITSCEAVLDQVAELDLALGPDLDSPKDRSGSRMTRGADAAASAALEAATDAAVHFIPMRSVIKQVSGATRHDNHVKHAVLSGTVRRAFLKAIGMAHNCGWPASPLVFNAADVSVASATWTARPGVDGLQAVVVAAAAPPSVTPAITTARSVAGPAPVTQTQIATAQAPHAALRSSRMSSVVQTSSAASAGRLVQVSAASSSRPATRSGGDQAWTPPLAQPELVSSPLMSVPLSAATPALAPWGDRAPFRP